MTTIPQFSGIFSIELDADDNKFYAMHGVQCLYKRDGKIAAYKSLAGAVKFLTDLGIEVLQDILQDA